MAQGNLKELSSLLTADPGLATARSTCSHPTLMQCLVLSMPPVETLEALIDLLAARGSELTEPLIAAGGMNNTRAIAKLLDLGADIEGNQRWSPLEEALYWNNADAVQLLRERGAQIRNLRTAAGLGDLERIARCFDNEGGLTAEAGEVAWPFSMPIPDPQRRDPQQILGNALVFAALWGQNTALEFLLARGAPINMIPAGFDFAGTPLHYAALTGRRETVDLLLKRGADSSLRDTKIGKLPEDWAEHDGHQELAEYLRDLRQQAG